jgi:hypothetical protein
MRAKITTLNVGIKYLAYGRIMSWICMAAWLCGGECQSLNCFEPCGIEVE